MNSLWSRAVQAQSSCRCRLCHHSGHSIIRRSATTATRRKVSAADVFTACYTTILGTATIIDANRKEARRKDLDRRLEQARAALGTLSMKESTGQRNWGGSDPDNAITIDPSRIQSPNSERDALLQELGDICETTRRPLLPPSWIQTQLEWAQVEAAIAAEERDPEIFLREPKTDQQLQRTTTMTQESLRKQDYEDRGHLKEEMLQNAHYPSYHHPSADVDAAARSRFRLGEAIRRIFNHATTSKEIVAKICYNLITSSSPPSIHTYNVLIAGFNRIRRPDLAQVVIDSYIYNTAWPATQQTMGLRDTIQRMRGVKDTGLHFRIVNKNRINTRDWLDWATKYCASRKYAYVQRARRGNDIGHASMSFISCLRNGGIVTIDTLQKLLTACLATVDHASARRLAIGFAKHARKFATMVRQIVYHESITTAHMCWLPYQDIFMPVSVTYESTLHQLRSLVDRARLEIEIRETATLCSVTLKELDFPESLLKSAQRNTRRATELLANFNTLARTFAIDRRYRDLEARIKIMTAMVKVRIVNLKTGYNLDPSSLLDRERPKQTYQQSRYDSICNALKYIQIHEGPMTQDDIKSQLFEYMPDQKLARKLKNSGNPENVSIRSLVTFYDVIIPHRPQNNGQNARIKALERELANIKDTIRATIFAHLGGDTQWRVRFKHPNWYKTPLEKLVEYYLRVRLRKIRTAIITKQIAIVETQDQETSVQPVAEEQPIAIDVEKQPTATRIEDEANYFSSQSPTPNLAGLVKKLHSKRSITESDW
ncbi:uncharacterized protein GGS25DRAFT_513201 [Hypoxylon fragiforme]|uniref:uncharacterized protein n=1 Tax=Hypoxylon fragiforme TaxID=63214 RepID=UPI0020C67B35|nr:uncharacterized protein GGS25DRAFT_513201 [Hypoxylon fragiforme]KAI2610669.1 hypothetical protein GGS25DRAFT_513201 [Hypoxylon fragiforme]